jgi:hypothetical protein
MAKRKWSQAVTEHSDAMDLAPDVFKQRDPQAIAESVADSAEHSKRRKGSAFQSAMSMLTFYANRAGKNLGARQRSVLARAKDRLRELYGRTKRAPKKA